LCKFGTKDGCGKQLLGTWIKAMADNGRAGDMPMAESIRGVIPFLISDFVRIAQLIAVPVISRGLVWLLQ
jgi:hypothetical protein